MNLTTLRIEQALSGFDATRPFDLTLLPKLEHLTLVVCNTDDDDDDDDDEMDNQYSIMDLLELPSLVTLTIGEVHDTGTCPLQKLTALLRRSSCSETLTSIYNFRECFYDDYGYDSDEDELPLNTIPKFPYSQIQELANLIPAVQNLTLALYMDLQEHIEPLARDGLLPNLVTLSARSGVISAQSSAEQLKTIVRKSKLEGKWKHLEGVVMRTTDDSGVFRGEDETGADFGNDPDLEGGITVLVRWPTHQGPD